MHTDNMMKRIKEIKSMDDFDRRMYAGIGQDDSSGVALERLITWITLAVLEAGLSEQYYSILPRKHL